MTNCDRLKTSANN